MTRKLHSPPIGRALVPVANVWPTVVIYSLAGGALVGGLAVDHDGGPDVIYSLAGGALVGGLGSMFSIRKHLNV